VTSKGMRWLISKLRVVWFDGWWTVSRDRPWLVVTYVWAVLSGSDLWVKCTSSVELENPFEWSCPRYRIGHGVVLTRRVWRMVI
jgi:hypothetical protein